MNPLAGPFLPDSSVRALLGPIWRHGRFWARSPEYRAWLRFNRQLRHVPRFQPGEVRYRNLPIRYADAASFLSGWHEIFVCGLYEIKRARDSRLPLLVDAGANIGLAPLFWKTRFPAFRYLGFEPDPLVAQICRANLQAWGCGGTLHELALAGVAGRRGFLRDRADGGAFSHGAATADTVEVTTVKLSEFITEPVDLLKVDIEGAEGEVLPEIESRLGWVRNLFVEIHSRKDAPQHWGGLIACLQRAGFRCYIRPLRAPWRPFVEMPEEAFGLDDQFNVFAVRAGEAIPPNGPCV
jgi:FkbM family methyltransferase